MKTKIFQKDNLALGIVLLIAVIVRIWGINFGLPHRYHIDEPPSILAALSVARGEVHLTYPLLSPNLQELLYLALFVLLFLFYKVSGVISSPEDFAHLYKVDPTNFFLLARGLSVMVSIGSLVLVYRLASKLRNRQVGLISVIFLAFSLLDVRHAHFAEVYSLLTFIILGAITAEIHYLRNGNQINLALMGFLGGIALGLRFSILPLGLTLCLSLVLRWYQNRSNYPILKSLLTFSLATLLGLLVGSPSIFLNSNYLINLNKLLTITNSEGLLGFTMSELKTWEFYPLMLEAAFGIPVIFLAIIGISLAFSRHKAEDLILISFPFFYSITLLIAPPGSSMYARYLIPTLPFIAFYAADGLEFIFRWLSRRLSFKINKVNFAIIVLLIILIPMSRVLRFDYLLTQTDTRTLALNWIEANIPAGSKFANQWNGVALSSHSDPEPGTRVNYEYDWIDPFSDDERYYQISYYSESGYEYLITSSFIADIPRSDPVEENLRRNFYRSLDQQTTLLASFTPYKGKEKPTFFFEEIWSPTLDLFAVERPGPVIKIYQLDDNSSSERLNDEYTDQSS